MSDCANCIHADITYGKRVIQQGNVTLVQNGGMNIGDGTKIEDIESECVRLMFGRKESLYWFIRTLQNAYDKWEERAE